MNGQTRYHAEVKLTYYGNDVRINIFADTLVEVYRDLANVCEQLPDGFKSQAKRELANADLKAQQLQQNGKRPAPSEKKLGPTPVCTNCGSTNTELISWTDKTSGESKQAWKCQDCKQWLPKNRKA